MIEHFIIVNHFNKKIDFKNTKKMLKAHYENKQCSQDNESKSNYINAFQ